VYRDIFKLSLASILTLVFLPVSVNAGPLESLTDIIVDSPLANWAMKSAGQNPNSKEAQYAKETVKNRMGSGNQRSSTYQEKSSHNGSGYVQSSDSFSSEIKSRKNTPQATSGFFK